MRWIELSFFHSRSWTMGRRTRKLGISTLTYLTLFQMYRLFLLEMMIFSPYCLVVSCMSNNPVFCVMISYAWITHRNQSGTTIKAGINGALNI